MSAGGADNINNINSNSIIFTIEDTNLYVPVVTLSIRDNKNHQNFLTKDLKDQLIAMNIKQKVRIKIRQINIDIFLKRILVGVDRLFILVYINESNNAERFNGGKYYLLKDVITNYAIVING